VDSLSANGLDLILAPTNDMNAFAGDDSPPTVLVGHNVSTVSMPFGAVGTKGGPITSVSAVVTPTANPVVIDHCGQGVPGAVSTILRLRPGDFDRHKAASGPPFFDVFATGCAG